MRVRRGIRALGLLAIAPAALWLGCGGGADVTVGPELGTLEITTATSGPEPDADGYAVSVDGATPEPIGINATAQHTGLAVGNHSVVLSGLAQNCAVTGGATLSVSVTANTVAPAAFAIACATTTGSIQATIASTGAPADPDGYQLLLDGAVSQTTATSASVTLPTIPPGAHTVGLGGVSANCQVQGDNPLSVTVVAGQTATAALSVTCATPPPGTGTLRVTTTTTGSDQDPDGYALSVDDGTGQPIGLNATLDVASLATGGHKVQLTGAAANCSVGGNNPRTATVPEGGVVEVTFTVICAATTGGLTVTVAGLPAGTSAAVTVTGPSGYTQPVTQTQTLTGLAPGSYVATAADVSSGATTYTPRAATKSATVSPGATATVTVTYDAVAQTLNLRLAGMQLTQSTQSAAGDIPLVQGRDAFLRVFALANEGNSAAPNVRVRLFQNGGLVSTLSIPAPGSSTPTTKDESKLNSSWNVRIPGSFIQAGLAVLADVDPENAVAEKNETDNSFPKTGTAQSEDVETASILKLRFVPVKQAANGLQGDVSEANKARFLDLTQRIHPLPGIDADVHAVYTTTTTDPLQSDNHNSAWVTVLEEMDALRVAEGTDRTYFGVVRIDYAFGVAGIGFIGVPTALGYDAVQDGSRVVAHELGHTWGRFHSPCANPPQVDPDYPYLDGSIGVFGMDVATGELKGPSLPDIMGYCGNPWISDYNYKAIEAFRSAQQASAIATAAVREQPCLLVWGRIVDGRPVLEPAFEVVTKPKMPKGGGPYSLDAGTADGTRVFGFSFDATPVADDPRGSRTFAFAVPLGESSAAQLESLRLAGPGGVAETRSRPVAAFGGGVASDSVVARRVGRSVALHWDAIAHPMLMVRDARSGQILSFARGGDATLAAGSPDLEVVVSDGVRNRRVQVTVP
jgi:CARDB protein